MIRLLNHSIVSYRQSRPAQPLTLTGRLIVLRRLSYAGRRAAMLLMPYLACFGILFPPALMPQLWGLDTATSARAAADDAEAAIAETPQVRLRQLGQRLQRTYSAMRVARQRLDRGTFDLEACAKALGDDLATLFVWVRDQTRWLAYQGALRGPQGVLMDRMGSHLDRSLLLAWLLQHAGHEVRLARSELTDAQISDLLPVVLKAHAEQDEQPANEQGLDELQTQVAETAQLLDEEPGLLMQRLFEAQTESQKFVERVVDRSIQQADGLMQTLAWADAQNAPDDQAQPAASIREALRDHWWVQVKSKDGWVDLDPIKPTHEMGDSLFEAAPQQTFTLDAVPAEQYHQLRVEVVAEQTTPEGLVEHVPAMQQMRTADTIGQTITLNWQPLNWPSDADLFGDDKQLDIQQLRKLALEQDEWIPVLRTTAETTEKISVRADGTLNKAPGKGTVGRGFGKALGALSGGQNKNTHLSAVFLRLTTTMPGREAVTHQRPVIDLLGAAARRDARKGETVSFAMTETMRLNRSLAMLGSTRVALQACWIPPAYTIDQQLAGRMKNRQARLGMVHAASRNDFDGVQDAMQRLRPENIELLMLAAQRRDVSPYADVIAITQLNLLSYVQLPQWRDGGLLTQQGFDIIENAIDVLPHADVPARHVRLTQGVTETVLEAELFTSDMPSVNAARRYAQSLAGHEPTPRIDTAEQLTALRDQLSDDAYAHMAVALNEGQTIVLAGPSSPEEPALWWRIDPTTGACLGIGPEGRGTNVTGYTAMQTIGFTSTLMTIGGGISCVGQDPDAMGCCMAVWGVGVGGEIGLAMYLGGGVAAAAIALGVALTFSVATADAC